MRIYQDKSVPNKSVVALAMCLLLVACGSQSAPGSNQAAPGGDGAPPEDAASPPPASPPPASPPPASQPPAAPPPNDSQPPGGGSTPPSAEPPSVVVSPPSPPSPEAPPDDTPPDDTPPDDSAEDGEETPAGDDQGEGDEGDDPEASAVIILETQEEAARFLNMATFGATTTSIANAVGRNPADILTEEFAKPPTLMLPQVIGQRRPVGLEALTFHNMALTADDQLRQRMVFALSQIIVASGIAIDNPEMIAFYVDQLEANAFGNYRDLLEDVTYTPLMASYLTYLGNERGDPTTGRVPDENYAREIMQLFTIGLLELNPDGTPRLDSDGEPIETYDNTDISGLARVFTGLGSSSGAFQFLNTPEADRTPLIGYPNRHSELEKTFLGLTIPAGTGVEDSVTAALDHLFDHPNVGPFISRQLIQRFTQSDPDPAYVARIATVFDAGIFVADDGQSFGDGRRGDLKATLAAILLDPSLYGDAASDNPGKVREPLLMFVNWGRSFNATPNASDETIEPAASNLSQIDDNGLQQQFFHAPSVFNFYRPGFVPPLTMSGGAERTAPEFQIFNEGTYIEVLNELTLYVVQRLFGRVTERLAPDYTEELALADDPAALIDHINLLLTAGRLPESVQAEIEQIISAIIIDDDEPEADRRARVNAAIVAIMARPEFIIQR